MKKMIRISSAKKIIQNFVKLTEHLCRSLFFNKAAGLQPDMSTMHLFYSRQRKKICLLKLKNIQYCRVLFQIFGIFRWSCMSERVRHMCFYVNLAKYLRTSFLEHLRTTASKELYIPLHNSRSPYLLKYHT